MARRYARDNRGRFAPKGTGATARGGRLKTAGGNKRQTQTMQASVAPRAGVIRGKVKRDPTAASRVGQTAAAPAATTRLKRSGAKTRVGATETNLERGRRGVASMSPAAKAARRSDVAERRSERLERITERQSGIVARRQINRASNYNPDGTFNQAAANANQRRLKRSQQLQERLRTAATGPAIASGALARKKPAKPAAAAAKPRARTSGASFERRRALAAPEAAATRRFNAEAARPMQMSGKKPGSKADQSFRDKVGQASYNRQRTAEGVARRAKRFHDAASQMHSAFSQRRRYSTISNPAKDIGMWSSSRQSAWVNDLGKRRRR